MKEKRYYFDGELHVNQTVLLEGEEFHHLSAVMRTRVGESVCLINGSGKFFFGKVCEITKKNAKIQIEKQEESTSEPSVNLTVYQALAKGEKLSLIMQKITELGASELRLFESKFCDAKPSENKAERLKSIAISAAKQCGRATITKNSGAISVRQMAEEIKNFDNFFVAYENSDGHTLISSLLKLDKKSKSIAIVIGSEGGFAEDEITLLRDSGADIVSLGKRILRTETATISCTAQIMGLIEKS